jgi:hypothetical protein
VRSRGGRSSVAVRRGGHQRTAAAQLIRVFWFLFTAAGIGGFVVSENPGVVPRAEAAAQAVADRLHGIFAGANAAPTAPPAPGLPPPQAHIRAAIPGTSLSSSSLVPPMTLAIPTAAAVPPTVTLATWSGADCAWAKATLSRDVQLDLAEAAAVQSGSDTRYGTGSGLVAYYQNYAAEWTAANRLVAGICQDHRTPTQAQISQAQGWFTEAEQAHAADNGTHPENADWNNAWIGNYQRLVALFASLPR